jgi:hypothetical protein
MAPYARRDFFLRENGVPPEADSPYVMKNGYGGRLFLL